MQEVQLVLQQAARLRAAVHARGICAARLRAAVLTVLSELKKKQERSQRPEQHQA